MNIKMAINSPLSQLNLKDKLSKQEEWEQDHRYGAHLDGILMMCLGVDLFASILFGNLCVFLPCMSISSIHQINEVFFQYIFKY